MNLKKTICEGIDVSHHQGKIDWKKVKREIGFAILRIGYSNRSGNGGLVLDKQFDRNVNECHKNGIPFGIYVYSYDTSADAAKQTAFDVIDKLHELKQNGIMPRYPVYYDIEYGESRGYVYNKKENAKNNSDMCVAFCKAIENSNFYAGIYSSRDFFQNYLNKKAIEIFDLWVAAYGSTNKTDFPHGMWQDSSKHRVDGISGNVDHNFCYKNYPSIIESNCLNGFGHKEVENSNLRCVTIGPMSNGDKVSFEKKLDELEIPFHTSCNGALFVVNTAPVSPGDLATLENMAASLCILFEY